MQPVRRRVGPSIQGLFGTVPPLNRGTTLGAQTSAESQNRHSWNHQARADGCLLRARLGLLCCSLGTTSCLQEAISPAEGLRCARVFASLASDGFDRGLCQRSKNRGRSIKASPRAACAALILAKGISATTTDTNLASLASVAM